MNRLELARWAMKTALKKGAQEAKTTVYKHRSVEIDFRDKEIDTIKETTENKLTINILVDDRYSAHATNNLKKDELEKFIEEAIAGTQYLEKDVLRRLPDPKFYPKEKSEDLRLFDDSYHKVTADQRVEIARQIEQAAMKVSDKIISTTSGYWDGHSQKAQVHSNGFEGEVESSYFGCSAQVTVHDSDSRPEASDYISTRFFNELKAPEQIGATAAERALQKIGQAKIESGKYDMLVENRSLSRLLYMLISPLYARSIQQKRSFLEGKVGQKIASDKLTIIDNPLIESGLGSRTFDNEGLAAKVLPIIDKGVLENYYIDTYYGKKLELTPTTGNSSNIEVATGEHSLDYMIKSIDKGILVNAFNGGNANSTTGDFSYGVAGMLIEKGELTRPVTEMIITGNASDFWNHLVETGNDLYTYSSWRCPSVLFQDIDFSGL